MLVLLVGVFPVSVWRKNDFVGRRFHLVLEGEASAARRLREELWLWLLGAGIEGVLGSDLVSGVNEVFINAVEHPVERASDRVVVEGEVGATEVVIRVRDDGSWNDEVDADRAHYGYAIVDTLMDGVEVVCGGSGTVVTLRKTL